MEGIGEPSDVYQLISNFCAELVNHSGLQVQKL